MSQSPYPADPRAHADADAESQDAAELDEFDQGPAEGSAEGSVEGSVEGPADHADSASRAEPEPEIDPEVEPEAPADRHDDPDDLDAHDQHDAHDEPHQHDEPDQPPAPPRAELTGHPAVDEVLRSLDRLSALPVDEHVAVFEGAHDALRQALSQARDGRPGSDPQGDR